MVGMKGRWGEEEVKREGGQRKKKEKGQCGLR